MNEAERQALVGLLMQFHISTKAARGTREELACLNTTIDEIDRLLAATPEPGLGLDDDAVDAVHPWAKIYNVALLEAGDWVADIQWPRNMHDDHGNWHEAQGLGPTRTAAIQAAVAKAKKGAGQ